MSSETNPLLAASELPYGLPPFDRIHDEHFLSAFEAGLAEHADEVHAIANASEPPTFENTVVALERAGALLDRVSLVFDNLTAAHTNATLQQLQARLAPMLAAHHDAIYLDDRLFGRVRALVVQRDSLRLGPESERLLERYRLDFVRAGAGLPAQHRQRLRELNERISTLSTQFQENLRADTNDLAVWASEKGELAGMSTDAVAAAAEAAAVRQQRDQYVLSLSLPTRQPALTTLRDRAVRERVYTASTVRGQRGNEWDTRAIVAEIARLRAERASLLGYPNHAAYVIADETARTPEAVTELLRRLTPVAVANAQAEAAELQRYLEAEEPGAVLRAWDWTYYAERVRRDRFEIDADALRQYFELNRVLLDGVFYAASKLYGLSFVERDELPKYHPDVRTFEVFDVDGSPLGLFLGDYYARDSKRGGAWMNNFVEQSRLHQRRAVVVNNLNIARPPDGEPTLLTFDEVTTAFHEFGHALHGLLSDVQYPTFSGANVPRDFVEYPSQVNEMWALWPEVLAHYAKHHRTGEPLPRQLVDRLREAHQYGEGFATTEYLAAAWLDQAWHGITSDEEVADVARFEAEALTDAGVAISAVPPRYRSTYFAHVFSGGYSAAYYSYIWSEVLDADTVDWFIDNGGLIRENGDRFRRELLAKGGSIDPLAAFENLRGRGPVIEPLLRRRGLDSA